MSTPKLSRRDQGLESAVQGIRLENGGSSRAPASRRITRKTSTPLDTPSPRSTMRTGSQSPVKNGHAFDLSTPNDGIHEEIVGGDVTVSVEPGQPPKLSRTTPHKIKARPLALFSDAVDTTSEAQKQFDMISNCSYCNKYIGSTEHGSMDCDCVEEWDGVAKVNAACGADSDCINRATKMECVGDCGCGADCQNQRFQQKQFAPVAVFQTQKKGYGLRADADLEPDDFIYEYIGEVIGEHQFRKRMIQYDDEGIRHFYFMSLTQGEFIDATKKGNLGRFCNHSCNPNCYVDKWVVGDKLRMGIFAERRIRSGEELTFNYNVDRYGADPQPCYCGELNCTGFIGGKTQTERATKLSHTTIEALGIDDDGGWDTAVAKRPRKKKAGEDDEEYVNNVQPKSLDESGVTKVMATLMQCKEKWITVKLLSRIQQSEDEKIRNRVVKMHGYQILNSNLTLWKDDANVILQIFDVLASLPRLTRNKIADSKIETTVEALKDDDDKRVASKAIFLLQEWSTLEVAYRIPRKKREVDTSAAPEKLNRFARRGSRDDRKPRSKSRSPEGSRSIDAPKGPSAPSGPRSNFPQRQPGYFGGPRPPYRPRPYADLPTGWFTATDEGGRTYYYDLAGKTTWQKPVSASAPPPPPPKPTGNNKALEDIINEITSAQASQSKDKIGEPASSQPTEPQVKKEASRGKEKWRGLSLEKQMRVYETTLAPYITNIMNSYNRKLPKDNLKTVAKKLSKKLVQSEYKNNRTPDPTRLNPKSEAKIKAYVKEGFENAVKADRESRRRKAKLIAKPSATGASAEGDNTSRGEKAKDESEAEDEVALMSDDDKHANSKAEASTPLTPMDIVPPSEGLKRKRQSLNDVNRSNAENAMSTPSKRLRSLTPPASPPSADARMLDETHNDDTPLPSEDADDVIEQLKANPPPPPPLTSRPDLSENGFDERDAELDLPRGILVCQEVHIE